MNSEAKEALREYGLEYFNLYYGCYLGTVARNDDPDGNGRLMVKVPQIYGEETMEYWAPSKGMPSGKGMGLFIIPQVGDSVWVTFQNGDPTFPIWEYGPYNNNAPDPTKGTVKNYVFQSPEGAKIELDDNKGTVRITNRSGFTVQLKSGGIFLGKEGTGLESLFNDLMSLLETFKVFTAMGPSSTPTPDTITKINRLKTKLKTVLNDGAG